LNQQMVRNLHKRLVIATSQVDFLFPIGVMSYDNGANTLCNGDVYDGFTGFVENIFKFRNRLRLSRSSLFDVKLPSWDDLPWRKMP